jgi:hypothetical protein
MGRLRQTFVSIPQSKYAAQDRNSACGKLTAFGLIGTRALPKLAKAEGQTQAGCGPLATEDERRLQDEVAEQIRGLEQEKLGSPITGDFLSVCMTILFRVYDQLPDALAAPLIQRMLGTREAPLWLDPGAQGLQPVVAPPLAQESGQGHTDEPPLYTAEELLAVFESIRVTLAHPRGGSRTTPELLEQVEAQMELLERRDRNDKVTGGLLIICLTILMAAWPRPDASAADVFDRWCRERKELQQISAGQPEWPTTTEQESYAYQVRDLFSVLGSLRVSLRDAYREERKQAFQEGRAADSVSARGHRLIIPRRQQPPRGPESQNYWSGPEEWGKETAGTERLRAGSHDVLDAIS